MNEAGLTLYAALTRWQAIAILWTFTVFAFGSILGLADVRTIDTNDLKNELNDSLVFSAVVTRVNAGESYYDASAKELEAHGYPTGSVFNWRFPTYAWILGTLPEQPWVRLTLLSCLLVAIAMASSLVQRDHGPSMQIAVAASLAVADTWIIYPEPVYFTEFWAGTIILISLCMHFHGNWVGSVVAGSLALILRELSLPFCVTMLALACWRRCWKEIASWVVALGVYSVFFYFHYLEAIRHGASTCLGHDLAWIAFGGITSVLSTCRMNLLLTILPAWITPIYLSLALLGLMGWNARGAFPIKITVVVYLAVFALVGQPFNFYWGWLFTPLLALGIVWAPMALRDLAMCATK